MGLPVNEPEPPVLMARTSRRGPVRWLVVALFLLSPSTVAAGDRDRAILGLVVNGSSRGQAFMLIDMTDVWVEERTLEQAGFRGGDGVRDTYAGRTFVQLASLVPAVTVEFDTAAFGVKLNVKPDLMSVRRRAPHVVRKRPAGRRTPAARVRPPAWP